MIAALRSGFDDVAPQITAMDGDDLRRPSAASEWDVWQVVSHLGSGAIIGQAMLEAALRGEPNPGFAGRQPVWDHWNAMTPEERRDEFGPANEAMLAAAGRPRRTARQARGDRWR